MFINNFDPVAFQILSFEVRWYSLAYISGIIIGWLLCKKVFIKETNINEKFDDYITYLIIGIIFGGRLGYIIFYNFNYYLNNIFDIFKIWEGGMSFHGGLIGTIVASILFAKKNNQDPFFGYKLQTNKAGEIIQTTPYRPRKLWSEIDFDNYLNQIFNK